MKLKSKCAGCYAGLACGIRIDIVNLLQQNGKMQAGEIGKHFKVTQPTLSHHLNYLKDMGVLGARKSGRKVYYYVHPKCAEACGVFI